MCAKPAILVTFLMAQADPALPDARAEVTSSAASVVYGDTKLMVSISTTEHSATTSAVSHLGPFSAAPEK